MLLMHRIFIRFIALIGKKYYSALKHESLRIIGCEMGLDFLRYWFTITLSTLANR